MRQECRLIGIDTPERDKKQLHAIEVRDHTNGGLIDTKKIHQKPRVKQTSMTTGQIFSVGICR